MCPVSPRLVVAALLSSLVKGLSSMSVQSLPAQSRSHFRHTVGTSQVCTVESSWEKHLPVPIGVTEEPQHSERHARGGGGKDPGSRTPGHQSPGCCSPTSFSVLLAFGPLYAAAPPHSRSPEPGSRGSRAAMLWTQHFPTFPNTGEGFPPGLLPPG